MRLEGGTALWACLLIPACNQPSPQHTPSGASIKTRKRNIAVPLDPGSFANAVVQIFEDSKEPGADAEKALEAAAKVLDVADIDFKRYGDTYFEVLFAGGRMGSGGNTTDGQKLEFNVRGSGCWGGIACWFGDGWVLGHGPYDNAASWRRCCTCACLSALHLKVSAGISRWLMHASILAVSLQVMACEPTREAIIPYVKFFQTQVR